VLILEGVKVICFDTLLQVFILNDLGVAPIWAELQQAEACPTKKQNASRTLAATGTARNIN
jgi:hypothetical protein